MSQVQLNYQVPPEDLQPFVTLFYHFRADIPFFEDDERADHAQLRFRLDGNSGDYRFQDGSIQPSLPVHVIGPTSGVMRTRGEGPIEVLGMGLQPAGWAALLGIDASAMLNRVLDGTSVFGARATTAFAAMRAAEGTAGKVAVAEAFVRGVIGEGVSDSLDFARRIDAWLADSPSPDVEELVVAAGLSRRQVERRCKAIYGAPPKLLARKYRALRAAVSLASGEAALDALIAEGFYDQSHLIRELKQFTGLTPRQLRDQPGQLARLTMDARRALGGQVHKIISDT
jgi:AraC-like DNA-binding protein